LALGWGGASPKRRWETTESCIKQGEGFKTRAFKPSQKGKLRQNLNIEDAKRERKSGRNKGHLDPRQAWELRLRNGVSIQVKFFIC